MRKKLVVIPSDPLEAYERKHIESDYIERRFNPGEFFDCGGYPFRV